MADWGLQIYSSTGEKYLDMDGFGISLHDEFTVYPDNSGSKTYPELSSWFNKLWITQYQEQHTAIGFGYVSTYQGTNELYRTDRLESIHSLNITVQILEGNIPQLTWTPRIFIGYPKPRVFIKVSVS